MTDLTSAAHTNMAEVRLLVLSDLHAHDAGFVVANATDAPTGSPGKPSWLDYSGRRTLQSDPVLSLLSYIDRERIRADVVVIPGDVCHQANGEALRHAWSEIEVIRQRCGAVGTVATAGNHDLDSRYRGNAYDPLAALKELNPVFPLQLQTASDAYWGYAVTQVVIADTRFIVLNSCAHHGGVPSEMKHGRLGHIAFLKIRQMLEQSAQAKYNVLLCHHHPYPFPGQEAELDDRMLDGESLLEALDQSSEDWLIIHGHRHMARLAYANGGGSSPAILAAGSMSVRLSPHLTTITRNQVHLVTLDTDAVGDLRGTVESWNFSPASGWERATGGLGLPHLCGFGYRASLRKLVQEVRGIILARGGPVRWSQLTDACQELKYLTPPDLARLVRECRAAGIPLDVATDGRIVGAALDDS